MQLLHTIDNLAMVSDALSGTVQSSEDHTPLLLSQDEDELVDDDLLLKLLPTSSSPRLKMPRLPLEDLIELTAERDVSLPVQFVEAREVVEGELREGKLADKGDTTVSSLVLNRGEKVSKEELRRFVGQRKKQKSAGIMRKVGKGKAEKKAGHSGGSRVTVKTVSKKKRFCFNV